MVTQTAQAAHVLLRMVVLEWLFLSLSSNKCIVMVYSPLTIDWIMCSGLPVHMITADSKFPTKGAQSKIPLPFLPTQQVSSTLLHHSSTCPVVLPCPAMAQKCRQGNREWADCFSPSPLMSQVLNSPSFPAWTMMLFSLHWSPCFHFCSHFNSFSSQQQEWVFWNKSDHAVVGIWSSNSFPFPKE